MKIAKVIRPTFDKEDKTVMLTATIKKGTVTRIKEFEVKVKKEGVTDAQAVVVDLNSINLATSVTSDFILPAEGANGSTITWVSSTPAVITNAGKVMRPSVGGVDTSVTLTATASKGTASETKPFTIVVKPWTEEEELSNAIDLITWDLISGSNASKSSITTDLNFPTKIGRDVSVKWSTRENEYCTNEGKITRPAYAVGPIALSVTAKITHGSLDPAEVVISGLTIATLDMTNQEVVDRAKTVLTESTFLGTNDSLLSIMDSMILPIKVSDSLSARATITWSLANLAHSPIASSPYIALAVNPDSVTCMITRPTLTQGNQTISLCATISVGEGAELRTDKKYFNMTIIALPAQE